MGKYKRMSPADAEAGRQRRLVHWRRLGRIGKLIYGRQALQAISQDEAMPEDMRVKAGRLYAEASELTKAYGRQLHCKSYEVRDAEYLKDPKDPSK